MIRFSAALVVAGLGLLLAGALTSELPLVYAAITVSVLAAVILAAGVLAGRDEILGRKNAAAGSRSSDFVTAQRGTAVVSGGTTVSEDSRPAAGAGPASAFAGAATGTSGGAAAGAQPAMAAAPADAGAAATGTPGLGWPEGRSPADALWARVDAELTAAGAAIGAPKLTRDSDTREVWDRVDLELGRAASPREHAAARETARSAGPAPDPAPVRPQAGTEASVTGTARVVLVPGVPRYHRNECMLIRFLAADDVESVTRDAAEAAGCVPCRACQPDLALADAD